MRKKKRGFTLIEFIGVLVIMAIIALIVTPLIMNIIRKAIIAEDKRSVDAYGRSIELAIASYLLDNGKFPTKISDLTIEYSGDTVSCTTEQINSDSSVYLAGCTVKNRNVEGYTYGTDKSPSYTAYSIGDHVSYNGVNYYVIENSDTTKDIVKLIKENPLTEEEINSYNLSGVSAFIINPSLPYGNVEFGSSIDYETSTVKKVVDAWKNTSVKSGDSATARLITKKEIDDNFEFEEYDIECGGCGAKGNRIKDSWMYIKFVDYWTESSTDDQSKIWCLTGEGELYNTSVSYDRCVRPVLEISKTAELIKLES